MFKKFILCIWTKPSKYNVKIIQNGPFSEELHIDNYQSKINARYSGPLNSSCRLNPSPNASRIERNCQPRMNPLVGWHATHDHCNQHFCLLCLTSERGVRDSGKMFQFNWTKGAWAGHKVRCYHFFKKKYLKSYRVKRKSTAFILNYRSFQSDYQNLHNL